jgi:hypothetical protein
MYPLSRVRPRSNSGALLFCGGQETKKTTEFLRLFIEEGISEPTVSLSDAYSPLKDECASSGRW